MSAAAVQLALFDSPRRVVPTGYVYFGTDGRAVKIGYTTSPVRRGGELKLTMLYTTPGTVQDEREHHRRWMRYRINSSEWFEAAPPLLEWLDSHVLGGTAARVALRMLIFRRQPNAS